MPQFTIELTDEQIASFKKEARQDSDTDIIEETGEFNVYDYSGGNYDDAYEIGATHADIHSARFILQLIGETW